VFCKLSPENIFLIPDHADLKDSVIRSIKLSVVVGGFDLNNGKFANVFD
jgi:hypothetical protein